MTSFWDANPQQLTAWFYQIDTDRGGTLSVAELQAALRLAGLSYSGKFVNSLINMVDSDCSGKLNVQEFLQLHAIMTQAYRTFGAADRDRSGFLDLREMASSFQTLGISLDMSPDGSFYSYCKSFDFDKKGRFNIDVFIAAYVTLANAKRVHDRLQSNISFDVYVWSIAQL
eukprot:CAMPEP_0174732480 /NCGR_PEP_ID=MMETSP1094-20130205/59489_1 /TAXON_ID=156173 /ORGANISM="Chrysochromulina brevifilum, Strain UTEX LB 985" /LENGTH=170 /DNA_ID=CAMNT_0015934999 /DNA_START=30 /DNA_END=542 /DNA_ORIENTATION=+